MRVNADYWGSKIGSNQNRVKADGVDLAERGWVVLRFWEHQEIETIVAGIELAVRQRIALGASGGGRVRRRGVAHRDVLTRR